MIDVVEGNRIIAEFMEWELINISDEPDDIEGEFDCWVFKNKLTGGMDGGIDAQIYNKNSTLPFDTDWNRLMEVVHKCIKEMSDSGIKERGDWTPEHGYVSDLWSMKLSSPIELVWSEVVKYIKRKK